jgi:hypothetical protein
MPDHLKALYYHIMMETPNSEVNRQINELSIKLEKLMTTYYG